MSDAGNATAAEVALIDGRPMPERLRRFLCFYLLAVGLLLLLVIVNLCGLEFPEAGLALRALQESEKLALPAPPTWTDGARGPAPTGAARAAAGGSTSTAGGAGATAQGLAAAAAGAAGAGGSGGAMADQTTAAWSAATGPAAPPLAASSTTATAPASPEAVQGSSPPRLLRIFPGAAIDTSSPLEIAVYGTGFAAESKVRINGQSRPVDERGPGLIRAVAQPSDLRERGQLSVDVVNPGGAISNSLAVAVERPVMTLKLFGGESSITREMQLLLLVLCAGGIGGFLHALKSLCDFIGNRTLTGSWFWWYVARPFLGMTLALVFYAVLRAGLLSGSPADAHVVSPFGAIAVAGLVGMFADTAAQKLAEIFDTLFKTADRRGGKMAAPVIDRLEPASVLPNSKPELRLRGERLGKVVAVRLDKEERKPRTVTETEVTLELEPSDTARQRAIKVAAIAEDGAVSPVVTLNVTDLAIATDTLRAGAAGQDYSERFTASGGQPEYKWSIFGLPGSLQLKNDTGELTGKANAGKYPLRIEVHDALGARASKELTLEMK